jgi:hypothetical protein
MEQDILQVYERSLGTERIGLALERTEVSNLICVLLGCSGLMILRLRTSATGDCFDFIGEFRWAQ